MRRLASLGAILALYAGLVVWLTWPLGAQITTHLPSTNIACRSDPPYMAWALAYESHALATAPTTFLDANIYFPARHALLYGDTGFGPLPYFLPAFLLSGNPALALNLVFLSCVALTAWTMHLVVRHWTGSSLAGFVAAWTLLMNPWVLWRLIPAAPSYAVLQYFPVIILLAATPVARLRSVARLVPLIVLQSLADVVYVASAVLVPLTLLALARLARQGTRATGACLLAVLGLSVLLLLPVYAGHLAVFMGEPGLSRQTLWHTREDIVPTLLDKGGVVIGGNVHLPVALPWGLVGNGSFTGVALSSLALIAVGGLCALWERWREPTIRVAWAHAAFWTVLGLVMSMPAIRLFGGEPLRSPPVALLDWLAPGVLEIVRVPERLIVAALMGVAILAGVAFAASARRLPGGVRAHAILAAVIATAMYAEYRQLAPPVYPVVATIPGDSVMVHALQQGTGPLLELPVRTQGVEAFPNATAMYRSIFHWRPLLNGYSSYWPVGFPERMALEQKLPDPTALEALRRETGVAAILVRLALLAPAERTTWAAVVEGVAPGGLRLIARDGDEVLFAVEAVDERPAS